jgi:hypothetical protein
MDEDIQEAIAKKSPKNLSVIPAKVGIYFFQQVKRDRSHFSRG